MRERIGRGTGWLLGLAAGVAAACNSTTSPPQIDQPPPPPSPPPCSAAPSPDGVLPSLESPARGTVTDGQIVAQLCEGGALAYIQRTTPTTSPPNQLQLLMITATADLTSDFHIALPAEATRLELSATIDIDTPQPTDYTDGSTCGQIVLCAIFPVPASLHCPAMLESDVCPPGCMFSGTSCVPVEPAACYEAGKYNCNGGEGTGSWGLKLSSVEPYAGPDGGNSGDGLFVAHGSLGATLTNYAPDGDGGVTLSAVKMSLTF